MSASRELVIGDFQQVGMEVVDNLNRLLGQGLSVLADDVTLGSRGQFYVPGCNLNPVRLLTVPGSCHCQLQMGTSSRSAEAEKALQ